MSNQLLWIVSLVASAAYFVTIPWHSFPGVTVLKGLSVSPLALVAWKSTLAPRAKWLLTAALALSSLGDVLLDVQASFFVYGLGAFLAAHLMYVQLFFSQRRKGEGLSGVRWLLVAGLLVFTGAFAWWLIPVLGGLALPVMAYMGVLSAMVFSALAWRTQRTDWVLYGAFLFLISDSVLGAAKFRGPVPLRSWIVWATYYGAQYLITRGVLRELGSR